MTPLLGLLLLVFVGGYALVICAFAYGFSRTRQRVSGQAEEPIVSVIIPARDEAHSIADCLASVFTNTYPAEKFEVIVVDDLSTDDTAAIVTNLQATYNREHVRLHLVQMPENMERTRAHKKRAIEKGIAHARGDIILTTDADCQFSERWIATMVQTFDAQTAFVSGPVLYHLHRSPWYHLLALDYLGLIAVGAGAIGVGRPNLCNGANVAYRRDVFTEIGGFTGIDHVTSGDDELLMQKIAQSTPWRVRFCSQHTATVLTDAPASLMELFHQRRRWASKGAHYPSKSLIAMILWIYWTCLGLLIGGVAVWFAPMFAPYWVGALLLKMGSEAALLGQAAHHFKRKALFYAYFLPAQLIHIPYIVFFGLAGTLGGYQWKGRTISR